MHSLRILSEWGPLSQQSFGEVPSLDPSNVVGLLNELEERATLYDLLVRAVGTESPPCGTCDDEPPQATC
ncbi:MAG: hypothetical protein ABSB09_05465 [Acidimicrobiales bacterium]